MGALNWQDVAVYCRVFRNLAKRIRDCRIWESRLSKAIFYCPEVYEIFLSHGVLKLLA